MTLLVEFWNQINDVELLSGFACQFEGGVTLIYALANVGENTNETAATKITTPRGLFNNLFFILFLY
jgi:hypothetical protein